MAQHDSFTKEIDGHTFEIFKLDPLTSLDLAVEITQALAPAIGAGVNSLSGEGAIEKLLDEKLAELRAGDAIEKLLSAITKERARLLVNTFKERTHIDGKPLKASFELTFRGGLGYMIKWLAACVEGEWGNEFTAIKSAIGRAMVAEAGSQSPSILDGTGQSGG